MSFYKSLWISYKNGNTKDCKFVKQFWKWIFTICNKKWSVIDNESNGNYSHENPIKFFTNPIESSLFDYSDAYILVTGNITVTRRHNSADNQVLDVATQVAFKKCAPFENCRTEINDTFVDEVDYMNITMPIYNLIEYSGNYSDTSGSLWQFKRDEIANNANVVDDNAPSFKYKASLTGYTAADGTKNGAKIAVPLKYLTNFWRSLEIAFDWL